MKKQMVFINIVLFLLYSCSKDEDKISNSNSFSIIVGDRLGMRINTYDTLIIRDLYVKTFELDVNNDKISDFRLVSFNLTGPFLGVSSQNGTSVVCLQNSAGILSFSATDTLFCNLITDTVQNSSKVDIYLKYEESCSRIKTNDSIKKIWDQNKVIIRKTGQKISRSDRFVFDSVTITRTPYWTIPEAFYYNQDTTIYHQYLYLDQCNSIKNNETLFFGIKIGDKLGWIELMIMDDYKLYLLESALQK